MFSSTFQPTNRCVLSLFSPTPTTTVNLETQNKPKKTNPQTIFPLTVLFVPLRWWKHNSQFFMAKAWSRSPVAQCVGTHTCRTWLCYIWVGSRTTPEVAMEISASAHLVDSHSYCRDHCRRENELRSYSLVIGNLFFDSSVQSMTLAIFLRLACIWFSFGVSSFFSTNRKYNMSSTAFKLLIV